MAAMNIAVFHITGETYDHLRAELDAHQRTFEAWYEKFVAEANARWGCDPLGYNHRTHNEIVGLVDPDPVKASRDDPERQEGVPDGWRRLKTKEGLRPVRSGGGERAKEARDWVKHHNAIQVVPAIGKVAELLGVSTEVFAGLRLSSFGFADYGPEDGMFLLWPKRILDEYEAIEDEVRRESALGQVVPSVPHERVPQSTFQLAKERADERGGVTDGQ